MNLFLIRNAAERLKTLSKVALEAASVGDAQTLLDMRGTTFAALGAELDRLLSDPLVTRRGHSLAEDDLIRAAGMTPAEADRRLRGES